MTARSNRASQPIPPTRSEIELFLDLSDRFHVREVQSGTWSGFNGSGVQQNYASVLTGAADTRDDSTDLQTYVDRVKAIEESASLTARLGSRGSSQWMKWACIPVGLVPPTVAAYLPPGRAFAAKAIEGTVTRSLLAGLAQELIRSESLVDEFRDQIIPDETTLFVDEWERALGIPDDCFKGAGTDAERRRDVLAKLASLGVQTAQDFVDFAALFGVTAEITAGSVHGSFPYKFPMYFFPDQRTARHTIFVNLGSATSPKFPYTFPITFGSGEIALIECLFAKIKPANVQLIFGFPP